MLNGIMNRVSPLRFQEKALLLFGLIGIVSPFATPYMTIATISYGLIFFGFSYAKVDAKIHGILMGSGVIGDLMLVGILEYQRHAINTAVSFSLTPLQQLHVMCSSIAVLFYLPLLVLGFLMYFRPKYKTRLRSMHKNMGNIAFVFRSLGFLLMFSMLGRPN